MKKFLAVVLVLLVTAGVCCAADTPMKYIKNNELKGHEGEYIIVDIRKTEDYIKSHIPGAITIDMDKAKNGDIEDGEEKMKAGLGDKINGDKKLVLVCYAGKRYAQAGTNVLAKIGANMDNVLTLEGGFGEWSEVYLDAAEATDTTMKYIKAADLKAVLDNQDAGYIILDLRKAEDYAKGHIPGAKSFDMDKAKDGDLPDGMRKMRALGDDLNGDRTIVLVCYAGKRYAQAGTTSLALIGANMNNVVTLEGGFGEWSKVYPEIITQ